MELTWKKHFMPDLGFLLADAFEADRCPKDYSYALASAILQGIELVHKHMNSVLCDEEKAWNWAVITFCDSLRRDEHTRSIAQRIDLAVSRFDDARRKASKANLGPGKAFAYSL